MGNDLPDITDSDIQSRTHVAGTPPASPSPAANLSGKGKKGRKGKNKRGGDDAAGNADASATTPKRHGKKDASVASPSTPSIEALMPQSPGRVISPGRGKKMKFLIQVCVCFSCCGGCFCEYQWCKNYCLIDPSFFPLSSYDASRRSFTGAPGMCR